MSTFGDYKSYKKYEPAYKNWKKDRDIQNAKRLEYIKNNPEIRNKEDIQRGQILLRAIDIMDEYSQKRAEDMEIATSTAISTGLQLASSIGMGIGLIISQLEPVQKSIMKLAKNSKKAEMIATIIPTVIGGLLGTIAAFPFMAWGAKAEVSASRKGRFEAMRKELNNPNGFAVLTDEQMKEVKALAKNIQLEEDKKKSFTSGFFKGINYLKDMASDSKEYQQQKKIFNQELDKDLQNINKSMTNEEVENAKRDQQLLTKLVEKIDIASQDYAENVELATDTISTSIMGCSALGTLLITKLMNKMNIKNGEIISLIPGTFGIAAAIIFAIISNSIQKQASRVGRYVVKKELMENPDNLIYVNDSKTGEITNVKIANSPKKNIFKFFVDAYKNNKEYDKFKKTAGKEEKRFYKATEQLKLTPEQLKDAKRLQKNTFRTFNKIDENSQKYSESVEALGQAVGYPIGLICSALGVIIGMPFLFKKAKNNLEMTENTMKYIGAIFVSLIPSIGFNAYVTKEQKKASRIADMLAINEMQNYKNFR